VIEEAEDLTRWAQRSVEVAQRAGLKKQKKAPPRKSTTRKPAKKAAKKRKTPARKK